MDLDARNKRVGFLVLRLFIAQFWLLQFLGKLRDQESGVIAVRNLTIWAEHLAAWFDKSTVLPAWSVLPYAAVVPYCELAIGLLVLVGLQTRRTLIFASLLLVSLSAGMMLQLKHDVVAANTVHLFALLLALQWEPAGRAWSADAWLEARRARDAASASGVAGA